MSLPACQQRVLDTIEHALQRREPRLASMFSMFTRLTTNDGAPRTERLTAAPWWAWRRRRGHPRHRRQAAALRALIVIPVMALVMVCAMFLAMTTSRGPCLPADGPHGPVAAGSHARSCPSASGLRSFGHGP